jgi:RHS repeat-associated protein
LHIIYDRIISINRSDKLYYFNANHLGSGSLITDGNGQTYQTLAYTPYGSQLVDIKHYSDIYNEPYRFGGKIKDEESGLNYFEARYYWNDGSIPISTDPHWYNYPHITSYNWCGQNPIMITDPTGMDFDPASEKQAKSAEKAIQAKISVETNADKLTELNKSLDDISQMRNDHSTVYSYKKLDSSDAKKRGINGPTTTQMGENKKGQKLVNMYYATYGEQIHESRHGGDVARGTLNLDRNSSGYNYGVSHEVSAYKAQYSFDGFINLRTSLSTSDIHDLNMQGIRPNDQFTPYTGGVNNIDNSFVKGIVWFYRGSTPVMLYTKDRTAVRDNVFYSR